MTDADDLVAVAERLYPGGRLIAARRLTGGVSADVHALEVVSAEGARQHVVLRRHGAVTWKPKHQRVTAMEHDLLEALYGAGLPVPEPLLLDTTGDLLPGPFLVMTFVDGSGEIAPEDVFDRVSSIADALTRIHDLPGDRLPPLPIRSNPLPEMFDYLPDVPEWRSLRDHLADPVVWEYQGPRSLLHGDFWPGNLLWRDGRLVAILDWEDAALGDPVSDVAGCRIELLWKYGPAVMEHFTRAYAETRPVVSDRLALWEIFVGAAAAHFMGEWGLEPEREREMRRRTDAFIDGAASRLLAQRGG